MNKKKITIIISSIAFILVAIAIIIPISINNKIKKEKQNALSDAKSLAKVIADTCNKEAKATRYVIKDKTISTNDETVKIDNNSLKGVLPINGVVEVDNECKVTLSVLYGEYNITKKNNEEAKIVEHEIYENGKVIYYNPTENKVCNDYKETNNIDGCLKWYAINDKEKNNTITLLLDHNILANAKWVIKSDYTEAGGSNYESNGNELGPITLKKQLADLTKNWKTEARLVDAKEIASPSNITDFKEAKDQSYFFESGKTKPAKNCYKGNTSNCKYGYLYDKTSTNSKEYGAIDNTKDASYGYWTNTSNSTVKNKAWRVYMDGRLVSANINDIGSGIRPVIEIQKGLLK